MCNLHLEILIKILILLLMLLLMFNSVNIISLILLVFANWGMYHIDIVCFDQDRYLYMYVLYKYCSAVCFA